jgi:uncharacterized protein YciI/ketosteroid isomerase-like protein
MICRMMQPLLLTLLVATMASGAVAQPAAPAAAELTALLTDFLAGASRNDAAVHDRFWADDLVYTRAAGQRLGKAEIMRDVRSSAAPKPGEPATTYTAEDVRIQQYGDTAVVAFRLVGTMGTGTAAKADTYLNTGTFVKRGGRWQAVAWQATRVPADAAAPAKADGGGMGEVFLVLLKKGPAWTAERTDRTKAIQEGHMANIKALWEAKKMIIAGPMGDDGDMRGVFVFQAANRAEALALAESDPAVKAGRLVPEIHSWWVERRALPEAGAYCRPAVP